MEKKSFQRMKRAAAFFLALCMAVGILPMHPPAYAAETTLTIDGVTDYEALTPYSQYPLELTNGVVTYSADDGIEEYKVTANFVPNSAAVYTPDEIEFKEDGVEFSGTVEPADAGYISKRGYFIAEKAGKATLNVKATDGTTELSASIEVTVVPKEQYTYNFLKAAQKTIDATKTDTIHVKWTAFSNYARSTAGADTEVHPQAFMKNENYLEKSDPWMYVAHEGGAEGEAPRNFSYGGAADMYAGTNFRRDWVRFKIRVASNGKYNVISKHNYWTAGMDFDMYLAPAEEVDAGAEPNAADYKLGGFNTLTTAAADNKWHQEESLGAYNLPAGDYYLSYYKKAGTYLSLDAFILKRVGNMETDAELETEIFGDKYAIIQKNNDSSYDINLLGGLKKICYETAGFEVSVDGGDVFDMETSDVYTSISAYTGGEQKNYTASDFGGEYIFCTTEKGIAAEEGSVLVIKPYVKVGTEKTYYGPSYTVILS